MSSVSRNHATACVAANHLVALMGHVQVLAEWRTLARGLSCPLRHQALADVELLGVANALTGPASARGHGQRSTAHLAAIPASQRATYVAMANAAFEIAEQRRLASLA